LKRIVLLLPLLLAAGLLLRASSGADVPDEERVRDSRTADHMRRIELALATGHTPVVDHFLAAPKGAEIPEPPLFDAVLAGASELTLSTPDGPQETGGVVEERLEPLLARMPALLLLLAVCGVVGAVRGVREIDPCAPSEWAACAAGALLLFPALVADPEGLVRLESALWLGALCSLLAWRSFALFAARDPMDLVLAGLLLGVLASLALASGPAAILFAPLPTLAFLALAQKSPETAQGARRGGLLFGIVLVVLGGLGHESTAVGESGGLATSWIESLPWIGACTLAPHLASWLVELWRAKNRWRALVCVAGFVFLAALTPRALVAMGTLAAACFHARPYAAALAGDADRALACTSLFFALLGAGLACLVEREHRRQALAPALVALPAALAACAFPLQAALAAPLGAIALGRALAHLSARSPRSRAGALAVGGLALLASAAISFLPRAPLAPPEAIAGLRWMRDGTSSAGPWNAPWTSKNWSVLAPWTSGGLVAYHARRPPLSSTWEPWLDGAETGEAWMFGQETGAAGRCLAREESAEKLLELMHEYGVRYVIGGRWLDAEWLRSLAPGPSGAREAYEAGALARLVRGEAEIPSGLRMAWSSAGAARDPTTALVVYEVERSTQAPAEPEMRAR
jgi:hypothetical protein